jgi:hypothetical protein
MVIPPALSAAVQWPMNFAFAAVLVAVGALPAWADGVVLRLGDTPRALEEREMRAFIEWQAGRQTLFVATRVESSPEPALWLLPVPALPAQVRAVAVSTMPTTARFKSVLTEAPANLPYTALDNLCLDTGFLSCLGGSRADVLSGADGPMGFTASGVTVETVSLQSAGVLEKYLAQKRSGLHTVDIPSLAPYYGKD